ncbi:glycine dehydrogenase (decarboxylating) 1 [Citrus sinensis]|uniref:Glycine dehydrogenase (Decarboxylating) 1 n=1 Tax=Citrus sinensis TaxID=2711 RepID=A0ACB8NQY4_CITSI|nr:glycine dehydrogenase (decarboxylating) 1 [Citrus sinensis]
MLVPTIMAVLLQFSSFGPVSGYVLDYGEFIKNACANGIKVVIASDLLVLAMLKPPDDGGDYICGGLCLEVWCANGIDYYHTWHSAIHFKGNLPETSIDSSGKSALGMAMQTTERHIRKDKATSNICTPRVKCADAHAIANAPYKSEMNLWVVDIPTLYHTQHELLRYINLLLSKGSLPVPQRDSIGNLGSCIMKLNATTEMIH